MKSYIKDMRKKIGSGPLIIAGAAVIVENDKGELLLQKRRDNGQWGYAGGCVEYGEKLEEAAQRELVEETGILAKKMDFFQNFSGEEMIYTYPNGDEVYVIEHLYICKEYEGELKAQKEEVTELRFFHWTDLPMWDEISPLNRIGLKAYIQMKKEQESRA